jgi:DNA-binding CsgD family transcriptional regulator
MKLSMLNQYVFICLILCHLKAFALASTIENNRIFDLTNLASGECGKLVFNYSNGGVLSNHSSEGFTAIKTLMDLNWSLITPSSIDKYGEKSGSLIEHGEILLTGVLMGLILTFFVLSVLSKIRPYLLCSFWFLSLLLLYGWRSGYVFLLFPDLGGSPFQSIYFFVLQSVPLVIYLMITKAVTVLQAREYQIFQKVFTIFLRLSIAYLILVVMASSINIDLLVNHFKLVQRIFWVFLGLLGIPSLAWLVLSSRKSLNFFKFQTSFGLLFIVSLTGKFMLSPSDFPSAFLEPTHLLVGIGIQLIYMLGLLLTSVFENQSIQNEKDDIIPPQNMPVKMEDSNTVNGLLQNLSPKEMDIFMAYCNGFSYSEISSSFLISPNTVKSHLKSCYRKLRINSKVEAIRVMNRNKGFRKSSN